LNLIYSSFNGIFFAVFVFSFIVYRILTGICRKKGPEFSKKLIVAITGISFLLFFVYKYQLSLDAEYASLEDVINTGGFQWGSELPLAFCNVNLWLIPISILTDNRYLKSYCFLAGPLGTIFAIALPCAGFDGYSIFLPRVFYYVFLHYVGFWGSISLYSTGLYKPTKKDIIPTLLTIIVISFSAFVINNVIMLTGFAEAPNYFFTMYPSPGNPILEALFALIPIKYVYILPLALFLTLYMFGLISLLNFTERKKEEKSELETAQ